MSDPRIPSKAERVELLKRINSKPGNQLTVTLTLGLAPGLLHALDVAEKALRDITKFSTLCNLESAQWIAIAALALLDPQD